MEGRERGNEGMVDRELVKEGVRIKQCRIEKEMHALYSYNYTQELELVDTLTE